MTNVNTVTFVKLTIQLNEEEEEFDLFVKVVQQDSMVKVVLLNVLAMMILVKVY